MLMALASPAPGGRCLAVSLLGIVAVAACSAPVESPVAVSTEAVTTPTCLTIQRGRLGSVTDTYLKANSLRKNFGMQPVLRVSAKDEALLAFDLESIPHAAAITSATLHLYANGDNGDGTIRVHRVQAPWAERTVTYA